MNHVKTILPCSALQEGMILQFLNSEEPLYVTTFSFEILDERDLPHILKAWSEVFNATDILRTCFCETPDGYAQVVLHTHLRAPTDTRRCGGGDVHTLIDTRRKNICSRKPSYLLRPPLDILVLKTNDKTLLVLDIFHALYDGNSLPLIFSDLYTAFLNAKTLGDQPVLQPRPCQFSQLMEHILSCDLKQSEIFWKENLQSYRSAPFPITSKDTDTDHMIQHDMKLDIATLTRACKKFGCTPQAIFQAAWAAVLASYVGRVVTFGLVISGRTLPIEGAEETIGPLFNTIPCCVNLGNISSWEALVSELHRFNAGSMPYHHSPLRLIRKWLDIPSNSPVFDTLFVYQKGELKEDGSAAYPWRLLDSSAELDVSVGDTMRLTSY